MWVEKLTGVTVASFTAWQLEGDFQTTWEFIANAAAMIFTVTLLD